MNVLNFDLPAQKWEEALPLGNGRLGAMVFGFQDCEKIQLNEDSIWSGQFYDRNNPAAKDALPAIRRLLDEGSHAAAEELCLEAFSGIPHFQSVYQTAGELQIRFSPTGSFGLPWSGIRSGDLLAKDNVKSYKRELNISDALHTVSFEYDSFGNSKADTVFYKRECFISASCDLLVMRFSASDSAGNPVQGKISFRANLDRGISYNRKGNTGDCAFIARDTDIPFCAMIKVLEKGGDKFCRGGFITLENADSALLFLDIRTGFRETDCTAACIKNIEKASSQNWEQLLFSHIESHQKLYNRLQLDIQGGEYTTRYFNFCRYLLISCSRPGTLPANLQGIWNPHLDPPWGSDYTININTEMNYWPSSMCNLAETEEPLFDLLERMYPNGKKTAVDMYGCRGFTAHHNTNLWGDTAPRDYWLPGSYWALGAAWLCIHIWEHYEYSLDTEFLKKYFYLLKEACVFFIDFLISGKNKNKEGEPYLIVSPSSSPENSFIVNGEAVCLCTGCEMDNQILRKLFKSAIQAAKILNIKDTLIEQFVSVLEKLPSPAIGSNGSIMEWLEEREEAEPGHRHFSHLFALWPGDEIDLEETPGLAEAAKKTLERRLGAHGGHTGWSRSWLINFYARLKEAGSAKEHLDALYKDFTLPNFFNSHPPFQIDGNFGSLAGITQMLFQSGIRYNDGGFVVTLDILPALPKQWKTGSIKGARAKGNLKLDFSWEDGRLTELVIDNLGEKNVFVKIIYNNLNEDAVIREN